jgi:putative oxidoreductase
MLDRTLSRFAPYAYTLLRVVAGVMFSVHGMQKILGILTDKQPPVGSQLWIGGIIELVCGLLIATGFFTRAAAFLASGTMAVAYIQYHWKLALDERFFPVVNKGELAALYCFVFLYLACAGAGRFSFDGSRGRR